VNRFLTEVQTECLIICKRRKLDPHIGKQIAHDVFEKIRKYKSFKPERISATTSHKGILIYLYHISRNLFNDWHKNEKRDKEDYTNSYFEHLIESLVIPDTPDKLKWKRDVSSKIFNKLNKKEQAVVIADIEHKRLGVYLPDEVSENLALTLGVKKSTIRKIRERAIEKIKKAIDEINQE
jgi:RNA polymerase sigma factor (sigma-70 family)